jgi:hypothetical protein
MDIKQAVLWTLNNALRIFEDKLTRPQTKAVKSLVRWIIRKSTTVLSKLNEEDIANNKYREKISKHLNNIDILSVIEEKAYRSAKKKIQEDDKFVYMSYDESDIFKPNAEKMQWLRWLRDWSTWLTGKGYLLRWININWISVYSRIEEADDNKISKAEYIMEAIDATYQAIDDERLVCIIDRWWDSIELIDEFIARKRWFIIRGKSNRKVKVVWQQKMIKIDQLPLWKSEIELEWMTVVYAWRLQRKGFREPIILLTNIEDMTWNEALEVYLKRWKIEEDFNKMKDLWIEDVRVMKFSKVKNLLALIQFIVVLSQDVFNEVMERTSFTAQWIYMHFQKFCKKQATTLNPQSFIRFVSENIKYYESYNISWELDSTLFGWRRELKKMGLI